MINILGKSLAFLHVALSVMLMALAVALYINAVDFGWKQPARYWREVEGKKGQNVLIPSLFDKREAAMRQLVRVREDQLAQLGGRQHQRSNIELILGENHLEGEAILAALENGGGTMEIRTVKQTDNGLLLKPGSDPRVGFPALATVVPGINMSYTKYKDKLEEVDKEIERVQAHTKDLQAQQQQLTDRLTGKVDDKGQPERDKSGSVIAPGWYHLKDMEAQAQRELQKELEYVQPLWVKELLDASMVVSRRDSLLRRLNELGDKGYLTQSEFLNNR